MIHLGIGFYLTASENNWRNWILEYVLGLLPNLMARFTLKYPMNYWKILIPFLAARHQRTLGREGDQRGQQRRVGRLGWGGLPSPPFCPGLQGSQELLQKTSPTQIYIYLKNSATFRYRQPCRFILSDFTTCPLLMGRLTPVGWMFSSLGMSTLLCMLQSLKLRMVTPKETPSFLHLGGVFLPI